MINEVEFWLSVVKISISLYGIVRSGNWKMSQELKDHLSDLFEFILEN